MATRTFIAYTNCDTSDKDTEQFFATVRITNKFEKNIIGLSHAVVIDVKFTS